LRDLDEQIRISSPSTQWMVPGVAGSACPAVEKQPRIRPLNRLIPDFPCCQPGKWTWATCQTPPSWSKMASTSPLQCGRTLWVAEIIELRVLKGTVARMKFVVQRPFQKAKANKFQMRALCTALGFVQPSFPVESRFPQKQLLVVARHYVAAARHMNP